jgi:hypothetical protein
MRAIYMTMRHHKAIISYTYTLALETKHSTTTMAKGIPAICYYLVAVLATYPSTSDAFSIHSSSSSSCSRTIAPVSARREQNVVDTQTIVEAAHISTRIQHRRRRQAPSVALCSSSSTGTLYSADDNDAPMVWLFTKEGCPKTATVVEMLSSLRADFPHDLEAVDICDDENRATWFSMYQDDTPVLHMDDDYWAKNGDLTESEARSAFEECLLGNFKAREGEPDADGGDGMEAAMHVGRA